MKLQIALLTLLALSGIALFTLDSPSKTLQMTPTQEDESMYQRYMLWKQENGKPTTNSPQEDQYRFTLFKANQIYIDQYNKDHSDHKLKANIFSDLTEQEIQEKYMGINTENLPVLDEILTENADFQQDLSEDVPPVSINWQDKGVLSPVLNQGSCGSCWAFSTIGSLEGFAAIQTGQYQAFSQQQLVSCAPKPYFNGCKGSQYPFYPWEYVKKNGIMSAEEYPYVQAQQGHQDPLECKYDAEKVVYNLDKYDFMYGKSLTDIFKAVVEQPISILVNASPKAFNQHHSGIIKVNECSGHQVNHAILLVGYNLQAEVPYFIVKNQWGTSWGENGFAKLEFSGSKWGTCGMNRYPSRPL